MLIFAIETSCDETSAAVIKSENGKVEILSNIVSSQIDIHREYGGVVPEIAAREHVKNINWVIDDSLRLANIKPEKIDLMAVTAGPGLITSLIVGVEAAKALSLAWQKPLLPVNHIFAHLAANFASGEIAFPAVSLVVSGGHTEIIVIKDHNHFKKIGQTIDDAAGEAFDKVAKLLKLSYPGGPIVSQRATLGNPSAFAFPRPMLDSKDFNFSFSGLKTAVLYKSQKVDLTQEQTINDLCASFEQAVVDTLVTKTIKAAKKYKAKTILMAGGVAANKKLRSTLELSSKNNDFKFLVPEFKLCTDNAAMIGIAAAFLADNKKIKLDNWKKIKADPNWEVK